MARYAAKSLALIFFVIFVASVCLYLDGWLLQFYWAKAFVTAALLTFMLYMLVVAAVERFSDRLELP